MPSKQYEEKCIFEKWVGTNSVHKIQRGRRRGMKKKDPPKESKSIKTFFLYAALVFFLIIAALAIKAFFVIKQSKFDGAHEFIIAIAKKGRVEEIVSCDPFAHISTVLRIDNSKVSLAALGVQLGITPD